MIDQYIKRCVIEVLEDTLKKIKADTCTMTYEEAELLFDVIGNRAMNKVEASQFLHLSESQFSNEVRIGRIPEGKKLHKGDAKLYWFKRDLLLYRKWKKK